MHSNPQTLLAFDFGTKRIGLAVGQTLTQQATPLRSLHSQQNIPDWPGIIALIDTWQPHALVVGIPLNMDGSEQPMTQRAKHFAKQLLDKTSLPVHHADERLTTLEARNQAFEHGGCKDLAKADIDSIAAQIILQNYLDTQ